MPVALYQPILEPVGPAKQQADGNGIGVASLRRTRHSLPRSTTNGGTAGGTRKYFIFGVLIFLLIFYLVWYSRAELEVTSYPGKSTTMQASANNSQALSSTGSPTPPRPGSRANAGAGVQRWPNITVENPPAETLTACNEYFVDTRAYIQNQPQRNYDKLPIIYFVTPTYPRREQVAELTRLAHTLLHVPRLHWILANDQATCSSYLDDFCRKFGIPYTLLASPMPDKFRSKKPAPRGVANRRAAIHWLQQRNISNGVLYFGDDDNTYDLKLFSEIRSTQRVSMLPVGLIAAYSVSGPLVRKGKVVGFLDSWVADRHWPVDMAGFAVNMGYMAEHPNANMPYKPGYEEDYFLRSISLKLDDIEPRGSNCTEILVWHTQTKSAPRSMVRIKQEYMDQRSNLGALFKSLETMGVAVASDTDGKNAIVSKNGKAKDLSYFFS